MKPKLATASGGQTTAALAAEVQPCRTVIKPEFIRLPKAGAQDPYTGFSRSGLNALILPTEANGFKPPVKSICLRNRGAKRGIRLINYDSLIGYLHSLAEQQEAAV